MTGRQRVVDGLGAGRDGSTAVPDAGVSGHRPVDPGLGVGIPQGACPDLARFAVLADPGVGDATLAADLHVDVVGRRGLDIPIPGLRRPSGHVQPLTERVVVAVTALRAELHLHG